MYSDHLAPKTFADLTNTSADTFETEKPVERVLKMLTDLILGDKTIGASAV